MSTKVTKDFQFLLPLIYTHVRDLQIVHDHQGDITVSGLFYYIPKDYDSIEVDIDEIDFNGMNNIDVLQLADWNEIENAAMAHCTGRMIEESQPDIDELIERLREEEI